MGLFRLHVDVAMDVVTAERLHRNRLRNLLEVIARQRSANGDAAPIENANQLSYRPIGAAAQLLL